MAGIEFLNFLVGCEEVCSSSIFLIGVVFCGEVRKCPLRYSPFFCGDRDVCENGGE